MPAVNFSPIFNAFQGFTPSGLPLSGGFIQTYQAGTSTPLPSYTTNSGNVANANPIALLSDGRPPQEIWLDASYSYKFVLLDSLANPIGTYDNITGIDNTTAAALTQWAVTGLTVAYVNATTFTVAGNQTSVYQVGRRVRYALSGGQQTGTIATSVFGALTTVAVTTDSIPLDATLSAVDVGLVTSIQSAVSPVSLLPLTAPSITTSGISTFNVGAKFGNAAQADPLALDWYEENQFTPTLSFGGASVGVTYNVNRSGNFTRIGNTVNFRIRMRISSKGSSTGPVLINGLPYTASAVGASTVCAVQADNMSGLTSTIIAAVGFGTTVIGLYSQGAASSSSLIDTNFTNTSDVLISGTYQV